VGYYEFTLTVPGNSKDAVLNKLSEMGCLGFTENRSNLVAFFRDGQDVARLRDELNSFKGILRDCGLEDVFSFDYQYLSERDWNESWKKKFVPIDVGNTLSIVPPWEKGDDRRIPLVIDPGMAFGTGHHETTRTCLILMERLAKEGSRRAKFLDVGTGTGILAVAASRLGFQEVTGVDIDPLAVDAASRNVGMNGLGNILIEPGDITAVEGQFDMVAANLMSGVLIGIASEIASHLEDHGTVILSGILIGQEDDVIEAMNNAGLAVVEKIIDGRWVSLIARHSL
jgi:ribosomal protein L11 methyltransferase